MHLFHLFFKAVRLAFDLLLIPNCKRQKVNYTANTLICPHDKENEYSFEYSFILIAVRDGGGKTEIKKFHSFRINVIKTQIKVSMTVKERRRIAG